MAEGEGSRPARPSDPEPELEREAGELGRAGCLSGGQQEKGAGGKGVGVAHLGRKLAQGPP